MRALLFYLAARGDQVGRGELLTVFWPEEDEETGRTRLRESLSKLRAELPDPSLIVTHTDKVGLDYPRVFVDALEFQQHITQLGRMPWKLSADQPLPEAVYQTLITAVRLWRSPGFLEGANLPNSEKLDAWLVQTGQSLERERQRLLERLAEHEVACGDLETALRWLRAILETDELNEDVQHQVLELMVRLGRRSEALKYSNYLKDLYRREFDSDLPPATLELVKSLSQSMPSPQPTERSVWPSPANIQVPFVGRPQLIEHLSNAFQRGGVIHVTGVAGSGKSRLIQELFYNLEPAPRLLLGVARPQDSHLPFQTIIDLFRHSLSAEDWKKPSSVWINQLMVILPELTTFRPNLTTQPQTHAFQARARLFEAIRQVVISLMDGKRLLFVLDNAQWADEATLATLTYLVDQKIFTGKGLLVIISRSDETNPHLDRLLASARAVTNYLPVALDPLNVEEVTELTRAALGTTAPPEFVQKLIRNTGGNPLFLLETLRAALELTVDLDQASSTGNLPIASSIHSLIRERIHKLSAQTSQVIGTAAVIGSQFDFNILHKAANLGEDAVIQALEELDRLRFIRPIHAAGGLVNEYTFVDEMIREVVQLEMSPARKHVLHRRVAKAIEESLGPQANQKAALLARHYEEAGDLQPAFDFWVLAAQRARQLYSQPEATTAFKRAEHILQTLDVSLGDERVYQLYAEWAQVAYEMNDRTTFEKIQQVMLRLGEQRQSPLMMGSAFSGMGFLSLLHGQFEEGLAYIERALPYLDTAGHPAQKMEAYNRKAALLTRLNRIREAQETYQLSLDIASDIPDLQVKISASNAQYYSALLKICAGWPEEAYQLGLLSLQNSLWTRIPYHVLRSYSILTHTCVLTGRIQLAQQYSQQALDLTASVQNWSIDSQVHYSSAMVELNLAHPDNCLKYEQMAVEFAQRTGQPVVLPLIYAVAADLYIALEDFPQAIQTCQKGLIPNEDRYEYHELNARLGFSLGMRGSLEEGIDLLRKSIAFGLETEQGSVWLPATVSLAELYERSGDLDQSGALLTEVKEEAARRNLAYVSLAVDWAQAKIMLKGKNQASGLERLQLVLDKARQMGCVWLEVAALAAQVNARRACGQPSEEAQQRLTALLDNLQNNTHQDDLQACVRAYRAKILSSLAVEVENVRSTRPNS